MEDPHVLGLLLSDDTVNLAAHVCRGWRDAARERWPHGWYSGSAAAASSLGRFRWAQSIGCRWRGRRLLCAAARAGALDLLERAMEVYAAWDEAATSAAATADRAEIVEWVARRGLLSYGPSLWGAGPRVRQLARQLDPCGRRFVMRDETRDFRSLAVGAVWVDGATGQAALDAATFRRGHELCRAPCVGPTIQTRVEQRVPRDGATRVVQVQRGWTLVHGIEALPGSRVRRLRIRNAAVPEGRDPKRVWFTHHLLNWTQFAVELEPDDRMCAPELGFSFVGTLASCGPFTADAPADDDMFRYHNDCCARLFCLTAVDECGPLARLDGLDDADDANLARL